VRGIGAGRKTRRSLDRGGTGVAGELNEAVGRWPRVKITPMFGRWSYFVGPRLFGCFPLRTKETDLWLRLLPDDAKRAVATAGFAPHRRLSAAGWVECPVEDPRAVGRAIRWLRRAHQAALDAVERNERDDA
jgi:hypothetical protein